MSEWPRNSARTSPLGIPLFHMEAFVHSPSPEAQVLVEGCALSRLAGRKAMIVATMAATNRIMVSIHATHLMKRFLLSIAASSISLATLFADEAPQVRIEKDVAYLPADRREKADLYLPPKFEEGKTYPGVLIIHGGGWSGGVRNAAREINIGTTLASHGYVCMSIDYLLHNSKSDKPCWPQNLHDCKTAVRWMRANAERLHLDPAHIGVIGGSAGGHLSSMVGVTQARDGLDPAGPYGDQSCAVNCVVDMYGPSDVNQWKDISALRKSRAEDPALYKAFSVTTYLDKNDPPFLILHGTADTTVDISQSKLLDAALQSAGIEHHLEIIEGAPHTFSLQPKQKDLRPIVLAFFDKHLKR